MPGFYDIVIASMFLPFGGVARLRAEALDAIPIRRGDRILELGCGTGGLTRMLLQRRAVIHAVDGSERMLARARAKAPGARFRREDLEDFTPSGSYDGVLAAFVLHELSPEARVRVLRRGLASVEPFGWFAILDHAVPTTGGLARTWRRLLLAMEPPTVRSCIEDRYAAEIEASNGRIEHSLELAHGTARLTTIRPV